MIEKSFKKLTGVQSASASLEKGEVTVLIEPGKVSAKDLIQAVQSAGSYSAEVKKTN